MAGVTSALGLSIPSTVTYLASLFLEFVVRIKNDWDVE